MSDYYHDDYDVLDDNNDGDNVGDIYSKIQEPVIMFYRSTSILIRKPKNHKDVC